MKEYYEALEIEVIAFDADDIITTSQSDPNEGEGFIP